MEKTIDHRWGSRFASGMPVELRSPDGSRSAAAIRDVSLSGALLDTRCEFPLLSQVAIRPMNPSAQWRRAFVIRHTEAGMALEWFEPGMDAVATLMRTESPATPDLVAGEARPRLWNSRSG